MPVYNVTIDDSSPLFIFAGAWTDVVDERAHGSYNGTLHSTSDRNTRAILDFQGTAIHVFGSKGPNHRAFQATMDEGPVREFSAQSDILEQQAELFSWSFTNGRHALSLQAMYPQNQATAPFDIDYAVITTGDGNTSTLFHDIVLDDTSANFTYSHRFDVGHNDLNSQYRDETFHLTNVYDAYATLSFYGNAVSVYGATSGDHGNYTVSLDGRPELRLSGLAPTFRPQRLLYLQSGLSSQSHTLIIKNAQERTYLDIDYAVVYVWDGNNDDVKGNLEPTSQTSGGQATAPTNSTKDTPASTAQTSSAPSQPKHTGAIAGAAVGGVIFLAFLGFALWWCRRRRSKRAHISTPDLLAPPISEHNAAAVPIAFAPHSDSPPPSYRDVAEVTSPTVDIPLVADASPAAESESESEMVEVVREPPSAPRKRVPAPVVGTSRDNPRTGGKRAQIMAAQNRPS